MTAALPCQFRDASFSAYSVNTFIVNYVFPSGIFTVSLDWCVHSKGLCILAIFAAILTVIFAAISRVNYRCEIASSLHGRFEITGKIALEIAAEIAAKIASVNGP